MNTLADTIKSLLHANNIQKAFGIAFAKKISSLEDNQLIKKKPSYNDDELGLIELVNPDANIHKLPKEKQERMVNKIKEVINLFSTETLDISFMNNPYNYVFDASSNRSYITNLKVYNILSKPLILKQDEIQSELTKLNSELTDLENIKDFTSVIEFIRSSFLTSDNLFNNKLFNFWHIVVFENTTVRSKDPKKQKADVQFVLSYDDYVKDEKASSTVFYLIDKELLTLFLEELKTIDYEISNKLNEQVKEIQKHISSHMVRQTKVSGFLFREKELSNELNQVENKE